MVAGNFVKFNLIGKPGL